MWKPTQGINSMKNVGNLRCTRVPVPLKSRMPESWQISCPTPAVIYGMLYTLYVEMYGHAAYCVGIRSSVELPVHLLKN